MAKANQITSSTIDLKPQKVYFKELNTKLGSKKKSQEKVK